MTVNAPEAQNRTAQFARVLGPFLAIACAAAVLDTPHREPLYAALTDSALWLWALGVFGLLCGLTVVAFHQLWHSPAAMVISAFGWLVIIRSILLLAFPTFVADRVDLSMGGSTLWPVVHLGFAATGGYLALVGYSGALRTLVSPKRTQRP
jgi:hypothetical protein